MRRILPSALERVVRPYLRDSLERSCWYVGPPFAEEYVSYPMNNGNPPDHRHERESRSAGGGTGSLQEYVHICETHWRGAAGMWVHLLRCRPSVPIHSPFRVQGELLDGFLSCAFLLEDSPEDREKKELAIKKIRHVMGVSRSPLKHEDERDTSLRVVHVLRDASP
jgi:hypothetical protein